MASVALLSIPPIGAATHRVRIIQSAIMAPTAAITGYLGHLTDC